MTNEPHRNPLADLFGEISETDRNAALDVFGKLLMESRDEAIVQWDQILLGERPYPPWDRLLAKFHELDERSRAVVSEALPHIVDTFMYCLLDHLEGNNSVRVSVVFGDKAVPDIARVSWSLPGEPSGEHGWLKRFSKQRFEQPG